MSAAAGNTNARKWTEERVLACLGRMLDEANHEPKTLHIITVLVHEGLYGEIWTYWKRIFRDNAAVSAQIDRIDHILETKLIAAGLSGRYNVSAIKFALANSYKWQEAEKRKRAFVPRKRNLDEAYLVGDDGRQIMLKDYELHGFEEHIRQPDEAAKKWTEAEVMRILALMQQEVIVPTLYTHYAALLRHRLSRDTWGVWRENYSAEVRAEMKKVEALYMEKLLAASISKQVNWPMALYVLKRYYSMSEEERPQTGDPNEIKGSFIISDDGIYLIGSQG